MKIINEKGKLFGIINIIDLAAVLIIALVAVGGYQRLKTQPIISSETTEAIITMEVADIRMPTVSNIVVGDDLFHYDKGSYIGEIVEVNYEPYTEPLEVDGKWVNSEIPGKYVAIFKIKAMVRDNPDVIVAGGEQTRVGIQYRVKNKRVAFFGTVLDVKVQ